MGGSNSHGHDEYQRDQIKCRGYVEKYSFKKGLPKKRYFTLKDRQLSYANDKDMPPRHVTNIDKTFKILYQDISKREISIECLNKRGEVSLWKLVFSNKDATEKWANKLRKASRPVWEDPNTLRCSICDKTFKLFRRQHHCRNCGKVMCISHTKIVDSLPDLGYNRKVKICSNCVNRVGSLDGVQRAKSLSIKEKERASILQFNSLVMPNEDT